MRILTAAAFIACMVAGGEAEAFQPNVAQPDAVVLRFSRDHVNAATGRYQQIPLDQLDNYGTNIPPKTKEDPDPTDNNRDFFLGFPQAGVIRLGRRHQDCTYSRPEAPHLCALRGEIGLHKGHRVDFLTSTYYSIALKLAGGRGGAKNLAVDRGTTARLIIAQTKFKLNGEPPYRIDFGPVMALRYEDDQLYVTTEFMAPRVSELDMNGRCRNGLLAFLPADRINTPNVPYRILLAFERGGIPDDVPWEFDRQRNPFSAFKCVEGLTVEGTREFPRQPRGEFVRITLHVDGRKRNDGHVAFFIGDRFVACVFGEIAHQEEAGKHYFKFGPYGDLPKGQKLHVDYRDYRQGQTLESVGLPPDRRNETSCAN
jgi:hypothetical protein